MSKGDVGFLMCVFGVLLGALLVLSGNQLFDKTYEDGYAAGLKAQQPAVMDTVSFPLPENWRGNVRVRLVFASDAKPAVSLMVDTSIVRNKP